MNRTTFLNMIASESIRKDLMIGVTGTWENYFLGEQEARAYIEKKTGIAIFVYSKKFGVLDEDTLVPDSDVSSFKNFIDDNIVCLLPNMPLGSTWYGTTPEENDLLNQVGSSASVAIVRGGVAITTYREPHPVNVNTVVSAVLIPSFERINNVAVLHVGESRVFTLTVTGAAATGDKISFDGIEYTTVASDATGDQLNAGNIASVCTQLQTLLDAQYDGTFEVTKTTSTVVFTQTVSGTGKIPTVVVTKAEAGTLAARIA